MTGLGAVSGFGWSAAELWSGLLSGRTAILPAARFDTRGQRTHVVSEVPSLPSSFPPDSARSRRHSRADRFAVAAARDAMAQAHLAPGTPEVGVFFGGSTAGIAGGERFLEALLSGSAGRVPLGLLAAQPLNAPGDAVARAFDLDGPVETVSSACASGSLAVGLALRSLRAGEVDCAVAGGSDALCSLTYSGFNALRAVDPEPCRPFRADRAGLSLGEGAGVLVLEPWERALERGVRPLAELLGAGASCDAHHMTAPHPQGAGAAAAIRSALEDAGLDPTAVDFVNAHGTGTPLNDLAEWHALTAVFGERASELPVTSTKGAIGHLLGSAGAIEAVATVQSLLAGLIHPTSGEGPVDPAIGVDLVLGAPREVGRDAVALSTSLAFGGANAALILAGWSDRR
ncbi:MAG TPA: beta-ketoacyl-[acyl-carrier-protein] synthase family protein [Thermoanaerobaculia bacterium]|nr:beta-ketoacyl-[acyl-carrier-protein] synthase family protein [Thermoanaerobaculia bacterium]